MIRAVFAMDSAMVGLEDGTQILVRFGSHWADTDPVVRAYPGLFSPDPRYGLAATRGVPEDDGPVEQVTAAPGEKRMTPRRVG